MAQARETIECLINVFQTHGLSSLKAEHFRAAKFNKAESTGYLWQLLFELDVILKTGNIEEYTKEQLNGVRPEVKVVYCKEAMQNLGYLNSEFSSLPDDMSSGSREILLVIGWLMSKKKLLDEFVRLQINSLQMESIPQQPVILGDLDQGAYKLGPVDKMRRLQLVNGRLRLSLKRLHSLYQHEANLQHKLHVCTAGVSSSPHFPHLSAMEVYLLRYPQQLKVCLQKLEEDNKRLETLIQWKEHEHIFWKWMESVLQLKMEDTTLAGLSAQPTVHYNIPSGLLGQLAMARRNLESSFMKSEPVITQLEELWEQKQKELGASSLEQLQKAVSLEIEESKIRCHRHPQESPFPLQSSNARLFFVKPSQKKIHHVKIPELAPSLDLLDMAHLHVEIEHLENQISKYQCQLERTERYYRNQLDRQASLIPDAICIQPASLAR